jgi:hypothetical protein
MDTNLSVWVVTSACSTSIFIAPSLEEAKKKFLEALLLPDKVIQSKPGYFPGSYASRNILGKHEHCSFSPWNKANYDSQGNYLSEIQLPYTMDNINLLIVPGDYGQVGISFKSVPLDEMILTSHLDG